MGVDPSKPWVAEREIARRRRFSACLLAVLLTVSLVALSRQPSLLPFLLANIGLGVLFGVFSIRDPIPFPASNRSMIGFAGFIFGLRVLEGAFLGRDGDWRWEGLAAAFVGLALVQLFRGEGRSRAAPALVVCAGAATRTTSEPQVLSRTMEMATRV